MSVLSTIANGAKSILASVRDCVMDLVRAIWNSAPVKIIRRAIVTIFKWIADKLRDLFNKSKYIFEFCTGKLKTNEFSLQESCDFFATEYDKEHKKILGEAKKFTNYCVEEKNKIENKESISEKQKALLREKLIADVDTQFNRVLKMQLELNDKFCSFADEMVANSIRKIKRQN